MEKVELKALLCLAEKIQDALLNERDKKVIKCLENDLEKVKLAIAQRVFDLPLEESIFENEEPISCITENNSDLLDTYETSSLSLTVEKLDSESYEAEESDPNENSMKYSNEMTEKEIAEKFSKFINSKKSKSKIPRKSSLGK